MSPFVAVNMNRCVLIVALLMAIAIHQSAIDADDGTSMASEVSIWEKADVLQESDPRPHAQTAVRTFRSAADYREWATGSRDNSPKARYFAARTAKSGQAWIQLQRMDGATMSIPVSRLNASDQRRVETILKYQSQIESFYDELREKGAERIKAEMADEARKETAKQIAEEKNLKAEEVARSEAERAFGERKIKYRVGDRFTIVSTIYGATELRQYNDVVRADSKGDSLKLADMRIDGAVMLTDRGQLVVVEIHEKGGALLSDCVECNLILDGRVYSKMFMFPEFFKNKCLAVAKVGE